MIYDIKRGEATVATIRPEGTITREIMGQNVVKLTFEAGTYIDFLIGDTITAHGEVFAMNKLAEWEKRSEQEYRYSMEFQAQSYDLGKVQLKTYDNDNELKRSEFSLMGNAEMFIDLIIANSNIDYPGWTKGVIDATETKNLTFSKENCLLALSRLAEEFNTEFWVEGKTIHLTSREVDSELTFEYGEGNGLYSLNRGNTNTDVVTRLYAFGSTKNIPANYRNYSPRLLMPLATGGKLDKNIAEYGVIEHSEIFENIFPKYVGTISAVGTIYEVTDAGLDFNINDSLIPSVTAKAKIIFQTGQLAGYEFELEAYDHATKKITFRKNENEKALEMPSALLHPEIGDTYILVDLDMPAARITAAQIELQAAAQEYLDKNSEPRVNYLLSCDPIYFRENEVVLTLGNSVRVLDIAAEVDKIIRITAITRDLSDEYNYQLTLAESIVINPAVRQASKQERLARRIEAQELRSRLFPFYISDKIGIANAAVLQTAYLDASNLAEEARIAAELAAGTDAQNKADIAYNDAIATAEAARLAFAATLKSLAYLDVVEVAKLGTTIIDGGMLKNTLIDTVWLKANIINANEILVSAGGATLEQAQEMADEAQEAAEALSQLLVSGIRIGGRNYQINSEIRSITGFVNANNISSLAIENDIELRVQGTNQGYLYAPFISNTLALTETITISLWLKNNAGISHTLNLSLNGQSNFIVVPLTANQGWTKYQATGLVSSATVSPLSRVLFENYTAGTFDISVKNIKIELGNKASDWTPAPEDLKQDATTKADAAQAAAIAAANTYALSIAQSEADVAQAAAIGVAASDATAKANAAKAAAEAASNTYALAAADAAATQAEINAAADASVKATQAYNDAVAAAETARLAFASTLKAMAFQDVVEVAKLGTTIIDGGLLKNTLIDTVWLKANIINANEIVVSGGGATVTQAQTFADAAQAAAAIDATNKIGLVKLGGRNYLINSKIDSVAGYTIAQNISSRTIENINELRIVGTNGAYLATPNLSTPIAPSETVTFSVYIKNNTAVATNVNFAGNGNNSVLQVTLAASQGWTKYIGTRLVSDFVVSGPLTYFNIEAYAGSGLDYSIKLLKLEIGNKASDWTPAPEDLQTDAQAKATAAEVSAKAYADAQDALDLITAMAYADGIVDVEEAARIADATAKLNEAKADATTKAAAAQSAATAAAAADATAKVEALTFGGRNYILNSKIEAVTGYVIGQNIYNRVIDNTNELRITGTNAGYVSTPNLTVPLAAAETVTFSIFAKNNSSVPVTVNITGNGNNSLISVVLAANQGWTKFTSQKLLSNVIVGSVLNYLVFEAYAGAGYDYSVKLLKLETGNKATDWSPAPEDLANDAQAKATAAQAAAQVYAAAQDALRKTEALAYADGIVTAEEAARIAADTATLAAAQTDATTKAAAAQSAAIAAAAADATTKASAAQTAAQSYTGTQVAATLASAQSYADSSAQSKANVAQAAAIASAATDASTKAAAAQSAAATLSQQLVDGVKIGGRNYMINSNIRSTTGYVNAGNISYLAVSNTIELRIAGSNGGYLYTPNLAESIPNTETVTISFWVKNNQAAASTLSISGNGNSNIFSVALTASQGWTKYTATALISNFIVGSTLSNFLLENYTGSTFDISLKLFKLEKGNKATDWVPAPEDVQSAINTAQSTANAANTAYDALTASLKTMAYQDVVNLAHLDSTIIQGGKIKTTLLDADYIKANIVNAAYITGLDADFYQGSIGGFDIDTDKIVSDQYAGKLEIGSGTTPFIKMVKYAYTGDLQLQFGGAEMSPDGFKMGNYAGASGTFVDLNGNTITVRGGIITALT